MSTTEVTEPAEITKRCYNCKQALPLDKFYNDKSKTHGKSGECKECCNARKKKAIRADPVGQAEYLRKYKAERKDHYKAITTAWNRNNRDKIRASRKTDDAIMKDKCRNKYEAALLRGDIKRGLCEVCGTDESIQAHHPDYNEPLEIIWLCHSHHAQLHGMIRRLCDDEAALKSVQDRYENFIP